MYVKLTIMLSHVDVILFIHKKVMITYDLNDTLQNHDLGVNWFTFSLLNLKR